MGSSLIAFDTNHIKGYVFGTDKLREIRGASSILVNLNQLEMETLGKKFNATPVYANGGSGLFVVDTDKADQFGMSVQKKYAQESGGQASVTYAIQELPPEDTDIMTREIPEQLELLRWRLRNRKHQPGMAIATPSHPLLRICNSCGLNYAEKLVMPDEQDEDEQGDHYCNGCATKRQEDKKVKDRIHAIVHWLRKPASKASESSDDPGTSKDRDSLWEKLLKELDTVGYVIPDGTQRPLRLEMLRAGAGSAEQGYLGLIYADANNMGKKLETFHCLRDIKIFAETIDNGVYRALALALKQCVPDVAYIGNTPTFRFDVLLIGGDDIVVVTHASVAMQLATEMAKQFALWTTQKGHKEKGNLRHQLEQSAISVGVVLAPIKYPFGMLFDLVESVLKHAKKKGSAAQKLDPEYQDTFINFMVITGSTNQSFDDEFKQHLSRKLEDQSPIFYATLRPYPLKEMERLLELIKEGKRQQLGRTKLHQLYESVLLKNLTTSVADGLALLRNWKPPVRRFVLEKVYRLDRQLSAPDDQAAAILTAQGKQVIFPWNYAGKEDQTRLVYQTPLLDFVELYDFIPEGEKTSGSGN